MSENDALRAANASPTTFEHGSSRTSLTLTQHDFSRSSSSTAILHHLPHPSSDHEILAPPKTVTGGEIEKKATRAPFWLSMAALVGFGLVFVACAASLVTIDRVVAAQDGLRLTLSSSSLSWTYGPTAFLVIILSFWRRIDYYYKSLQPWLELRAGPASANRSVLLDYISPFQGISVMQAMKNRHYSVAATIFSFFLLKLLILISTTLFVLTPTLHQESATIQYHDRFDATSAWDGVETISFVQRGTATLNGGSANATWAYLAKLNNATTRDPSWNVADNLVTQRFSMRTTKANATSLEAPVHIFVPKMSCERATLLTTAVPDPLLPGSSRFVRVKLDYKSATCTASGETISPPTCSSGASSEKRAQKSDADCRKGVRTYTFSRLNCSAGIDKEPNNTQTVPLGDWKYSFERYDIRYAVTPIKYRGQALSENETLADEVESSPLICKVGYGIASANATLNELTGNVTFPHSAMDGETSKLLNFPNADLAEMLFYTLSQSSSLVVNTTLREKGGQSSAAPLFQLMYAKLGRPDDFDVFDQPSTLEDAFVSVMGGIATEFARLNLLATNISDGFAEASISQERLRTRPAALWTMTAGFLLLTAICLMLLLMNRRTGGPWIPAIGGSIAGHAAILANSPQMKDVLEGTGHLREMELAARLEGTEFTVERDPAQGVFLEMTGPTSDSMRLDLSTQQHEKRKKAWVPLAARLPMIVTTFVLPIIAIGVLELLQRLSDKGHGLLDMCQGDSTANSYIVRITSTLTVFAIATLFNNLDFTISTFAPYSSLRRGGVNADGSILFHLLSVSPFLVFLKSVRHHHFGAAASNLSSLIAGFLTVIVSGLWALSSPTSVEHSSKALINNWDRSWLDNRNASSDGGAGLMLTSMLMNGTNIPPEIWNDVVIPDLSLPSPDGLSPTAEYTYDAMSLQPQLNCSVVPQEQYSYKGTYVNSISGELIPYINVTIDPVVPLACSESVVDGRANLSYSIQLDGFNPWDLGFYFDLENSAAGTVKTHCPSVGVIFGHLGTYNGTMGAFEHNLTAILCSQAVREVPIKVTYKGDPSLRQMSTRRPPELSPGRAQGLPNGPNDTYTLGFRLGRFYESQVFTRDDRRGSSVFKRDGNGVHDSFISSLLSGSGGGAHEDFQGPQNAQKLARAVERQHDEYMRPIIHLNLRAKTDSPHDNLVSATDAADTAVPSAATTVIFGTASDKVTRLGIKSSSKIILQILLAATTVFSFIGYLFVKLQGTLPREPCSIASSMSFLAGSQLCDRDSSILPPGAEFMSNQQLRPVFDGMVFSLGWWKTGGVAEAVPLLAAEEDVPRKGKVTGGLESAAATGHARFGVDVGECTGRQDKILASIK